MKKSIILLIAAVAAIQSLAAQGYGAKHKAFWFDLQLGQHIGLNKWGGAGYLDDALPGASITELRGAFNFYIANPVFGAYFDMGVGIMPAPAMKSLDMDRMPMPNSGTQYYLRETVSESGVNKASAHFKFSTGLFGDFRAGEKLNIMPYLGVGGLTMTRRSYEVILKEHGSNMQYRTTYTWGLNSGEDSYSNGETMGFLTGRLNFRYKVGARSSLLLGLEYTYFFNAPGFYGRYVNTFNGNVRRSVEVEGDNMNMLGITVGISFR